MRFKSFVLCSTSFAAAVLAAPALAQGQPPAPEGSDQEAQTQPANDENTTPQADDAVQDAAGGDEVQPGEEVVVTGLRRSLQSAQNIKRNSEQIVDTIVAEDIGKLPDIAVSDTAARIPGVQVIRTGGEASTVLIRGLPDFATTYNGREIFTAETRLVALQDFPSSNIAALEVFKTTTADLVEAGLAGVVNVRSRRPFDFRDRELAGSVYGIYTRQAEGFTPNFSLLASDRFDTGVGEIGVLLNLSYTQLKFLDSEPSNTDFIAPGPAVNGVATRFPDIQRLFYREGDRRRPSANIAVQWRASDTLEIYAEGLYQGFRNRISDRLVAVPLYGGADGYSNLVLREGTNLLSSGTRTGLADPIFTFQGGTFNKTDTYQFAVGGRYDNGPLRISADIARTDSKFTGSTESVDRIFAGQATTTVDFNNEVPEFAIRNFDPFNPANYLFDGLYEEDQTSEGDDYQFRVDAEYELSEESILRSLQLGARYTTRDAHREFGNRFFGARGRNINATALPLRFARTNPGFRGANDVQDGFRSFLSPTYDSIRGNLRALRQFVIDQGATNFTLDPVGPNPDSIFDAQEDTLAGYAQIEYGFGEVIDGTIGIRVVRTETQIDGTALVEQVAGQPRVPTPVSTSQEFTDYLPNASLRWRITPELQLRLSATQTRTRPIFGQLNPSASIGTPQGVASPTDPFANARRGSGGNPDLENLTSDNYDVSLEYYFARNGFAAISGFRRDLSNFIENAETRRIDPVLGPVIVTAPVNLNSARLEGFEAQAQGFFDFDFLPDWARGFGAQANVTYINNELDAESFPAGSEAFNLDRLLGISKWTYNLAAFYEAGGLSARLSYNARSDYLDRRDFRGLQRNAAGQITALDDIYFETASPLDRLDLSASYTLFENLTLFFDWTNILGDPSRFTLSSARGGAARAEYPRFLRYEETTFSGGIRFRL